jgi:hypothetical protein
MWPASTLCVIVTCIMKTNEMHYFSNLFDKVLYMFCCLLSADSQQN